MQKIHEFIFYENDKQMQKTYIYKVSFKFDVTTKKWEISNFHTGAEFHPWTYEWPDARDAVTKYLDLIAIGLQNQGLTLRREYQGYLRKMLNKEIEKIKRKYNQRRKS